METKAPNRRKSSRIGLNIPTRVSGQDAEGVFEEIATTDDASSGGASLTLKRSVGFGQVLRLDLPLPKGLRRYDVGEPSYKTFALVRTVRPCEGGVRVGVMFLGKTPPKSYEQSPAMRFLLPTDPKPAPKDRRRYKRLDMHLNFRLKRVDAGAAGSGPTEELTIAENIGKGGARVLTSLRVSKGEVLVLEETDGNFRVQAEIRNVYIGKDNVPRLNLRFLDGEAPDRLVAVG